MENQSASQPHQTTSASKRGSENSKQSGNGNTQAGKPNQVSVISEAFKKYHFMVDCQFLGQHSSALRYPNSLFIY